MSTAAGFIGLGNMGRPMATNLARAFPGVVAFDAAGMAGRLVDGATAVAGIAEVAAATDVVFLSLPDGAAVEEVIGQLLGAASRRCHAVADLSTIGVDAAQRVAAMLAGSGLGYLDAPVSGGTAGARAASIAMMCSGPRVLYNELEPLLGAISRNLFYVGEQQGQGQVLKLLNNFLSATALAATSEAIAFGRVHGLDMKLMLDVLNVSSGQNTATKDKFPNRILPGTYDAGFTNTLMKKDVVLYHEAVGRTQTAHETADAVVATWSRFQEAQPGADFTRIYPFLAGEGQ